MMSSLDFWVAHQRKFTAVLSYITQESDYASLCALHHTLAVKRLLLTYSALYSLIKFTNHTFVITIASDRSGYA